MKLGIGTLTWDSRERQCDRYGAVYLISDGSNSLTAGKTPSLLDGFACQMMEGKRGQLSATVKIARQSTHIGDLFRRVFPRTPEVGQKIVLGTGTLMIERNYAGDIQVALIPDDGRDDGPWMDVRALYDAHEQTVELDFEPFASPRK